MATRGHRKTSSVDWTLWRASLIGVVALVHALGVGLALHLLHSGVEEADPVSPLVHWLRDSLLATPASLTALLAAYLLTAHVAAWAGLSSRSGIARATWALTAAVLYALFSVPGNALHGGLFGAPHEGMSFIAHAARDGGVTLLSSFALLTAGLVCERGLRAVVRGSRVRGFTRARAGVVLATASTIAVAVVLTGPKGFEQGISSALTSSGICPADSRTVVYDLSAFETVIPLNGWGDKLPDGLMYGLKNADARVGKADILKNPSLTQPLTIRANVGDCIKIRLRNDIAGRRVGIHAGGGLVRYDPEDSDGARVGKNPNTTLPTDGTREFTWYADHTGQAAITDIANVDGADPKEPTVQRGLYGALVVHPKGTTWHNAKTGDNLLAADSGSSFHAVESALFADVRDGNGDDFRSFAMVMLDENEGVVDRDGKAPTFPTTGLEDSTFGINYRSEPLRNRLRAILEHRGTVTPENPNGRRKAIVLPTGRVIDPNDHFCDGYVPDLDKVVDDPGAKCLSEESHLQSWVFGDESKLTHTIDEIQKVVVAGAAGGTFKLTWRSQTTAPIPYDAGPAAVQTALEGLTTVRPGDVAVSAADPSAGEAVSKGGVNVKFEYHYAGGNQPQMSVDASGLTAPQTAAADATATPTATATPAAADATATPTATATATPAAAAAPAPTATVKTTRNGAGIVVDSDNVIPKAYKQDRIKFHVIHPGAKETHPWHQHTQRWFADPGNKGGANGENVSPRNDVQSIGPGDSRMLDIEGGAGGEQKTVGDSIFHCHLYPHFAQGFWGHLRIYDRLRDGTQKLPDGSPLEALQELPDRSGKTPAADADHPGFPLFVKGDVGQRAYRPPNAVIKDDFAALRRPGDAPRGPTAAEAASLPGLGAAQVSADGKTNTTPNPGAGYIDPCPSTANLRVYKPHAVDTGITYNKDGWKDREGRVYVEGDEGVAAVRAGKNPEPYTIRARLGECVQLQTTNDLHLDDDPAKPIDHVNDRDGDYFTSEETSEVSTHVHLVQFDELGSDGTSVGWNYSQSAMPGQTYGYRWYVDQPLRTVFFHDHQYANLHQMKGLFAAMNVEPADAQWRDPKTGEATNGVGTVADIVSPSGKDFRELTVFYQDRAPMWKKDAAGTPGAGAAVEPPDTVGDYGADQGGVAINYRNAPFQTRTKGGAAGAKGDPAYTFSSVVHGDPDTPIFQAYEKDPVIVRNVAGSHEEAHTFNLHGHRWLNEPDNPTSALNDTQSMTLAEYFNYDIQGTTLFRRKATASQTLATAQTIGDGAPQLLEAGAGKPGDYLYGSTILDAQWLGAWGIFRVPKEPVSDLKPLPDQVAAGTVPKDIAGDDEWGAQSPADTAPLPNPTAGRAACPTTAPQRNYQITALRTKITYNEKQGDHDPNGLLYAPTSDVSFDTAGVASLKAGVKPKPLYLRANAGDCVRVTLRNGLPPSGLPAHTGDAPLPADVGNWPSGNRVSIHAGMVKSDVYMSDGTTVGYNWDQTIKPGDTKVGFWWVDEPLDGSTIPLVDFGDRRGHRHHGLWGGLLVEPKGSTWTDPKTGASLAGTLDATTGLITGTKTADTANIKWTKPDGTVEVFREFVAGWQDGLNLRQTDGSAVPVSGHVDDPYEMGNRGVNYRTERFAPRLAFSGAQSNVFSSAVHGDPATPVFRAYVGDPVKFRVLQGQDRGRAHTFLLDGHEWPNQHTDPTSMPRSSQDGLLPGRAFTFNLIGGAGGRQRASGDYLWRDGLMANQLNAGLWGLLRVHSGLQSDLPPLK